MYHIIAGSAAVNSIYIWYPGTFYLNLKCIFVCWVHAVLDRNADRVECDLAPCMHFARARSTTCVDIVQKAHECTINTTVHENIYAELQGKSTC